MKLIILGLDAMNIPLVRRHPKEMPNLNRLLDEGAVGVLKSIIPPFTGPAWVSFQTGKKVGNHGLLNFYKYDENLNLSLANGNDVKEKPFYAYCDEYGKKCFVMNLPYTEPPRIEGDIVYSWLAVKNEIDGLTHPVSLIEKFPSLKSYKNYPDRSKSVRQYLKSTYELEHSRIAVVKEVVSSKEYDVAFFMLGGTDWIQHKAYLDLMDRKNNFKARISRKLLVEVDELVGWTVKSLDENTNLLIMSDHGFREYRGKFFVNSWLKNHGYLTVMKERKKGKEVVEHINQTEKKKNLNISKLVIFLKKHPRLLKISELFYDLAIRFVPFNLVKQPAIDMKQSKAYCLSILELIIYLNKSLAEDEKKKLRKEIISQLNNFPEFKALDATEYFKGKYAGEGRLGDIIILPGNYELDSTIGEQEFLEIRRCWHGMDGIFVGYGNAFRKTEVKDAELIDVMPTILYLMGIPVPDDVDGKVLKEAINVEKIVPAEKKRDNLLQEKEKNRIKDVLGKIKI